MKQRAATRHNGLLRASVRRRLEPLSLRFARFVAPVRTRFLWRPQLHDPADKMMLEVAINGNADALVKFNRGDFGDAPGRFGIAILSPQEALMRRISA